VLPNKTGLPENKNLFTTFISSRFRIRREEGERERERERADIRNPGQGQVDLLVFYEHSEWAV